MGGGGCPCSRSGSCGSRALAQTGQPAYGRRLIRLALGCKRWGHSAVFLIFVVFAGKRVRLCVVCSHNSVSRYDSMQKLKKLFLICLNGSHRFSCSVLYFGIFMCHNAKKDIEGDIAANFPQ